MGLRDIILAVDDRRSEIVDIPEWGVKVKVRSLSVAEQQQFLESVRKRTGSKQDSFQIDRTKFTPQLIIKTVVDPDTDQPVFEAADAEAIASKSSAAISRISEVAVRLGGLGDSQVEETMVELKETQPDV